MKKDRFKEFIDNFVDGTVFLTIMLIAPVFKFIEGLNFIIDSWINITKNKYRTYEVKKAMKRYDKQ